MRVLIVAVLLVTQVVASQAGTVFSVCGLSFCRYGEPTFVAGATVYVGQTSDKSEYGRRTVFRYFESMKLNFVRLTEIYLDRDGDVSRISLDRLVADIGLASAAGLMVEIDLSSVRNDLIRRCINPYLSKWDTYLSQILSEPVPGTGFLVRNHPSVAFFAISGEPEPTHAICSGSINLDTNSLLQFYDVVSREFRNKGWDGPISTGGLGYIDFDSGIDWRNIMALPNISFCSLKTYGGMLEYAVVVSDYCRLVLRKPILNEEFGWPRSLGDSSRASAFTRTIDTIKKEHFAGFVLWNLGSEMNPDSFDFSPSDSILADAIRKTTISN